MCVSVLGSLKRDIESLGTGYGYWDLNSSPVKEQ